MARISDEMLTNILSLIKELLERLDEATETELIIFEAFGETEETLPELQELQNIRERVEVYYSRFSTMLRIIYLSQPTASRASLELLVRTIEEVNAVSSATLASIEEIKRNWNLS